ncbi:MAG: hypothetical protein A2038_03275 [Deltaproteobacteria bacterium GWA2_57_13]|nr:MAG: hypothetical protein A2038_03275 [Deltaproteobacteria bacterium GWA2_57_13]
MAPIFKPLFPSPLMQSMPGMFWMLTTQPGVTTRRLMSSTSVTPPASSRALEPHRERVLTASFTLFGSMNSNGFKPRAIHSHLPRTIDGSLAQEAPVAT